MFVYQISIEPRLGQCSTIEKILRKWSTEHFCCLNTKIPIFLLVIISFDLSTVISTDAYNPNSKHKPRIADKLPLKMICEPNRIYWWCSCGHSVNQPFCDGHHIRIIGQTPHFKINKPQFKPIKVTFKE